MAQIVDGNKIANSILLKLKAISYKPARHSLRHQALAGGLKAKGQSPKLGVVLVGNNPASEIYVRKKGLTAEKINIDFALYRYPAAIKQQDLVEQIELIQKREKLTGLIVQLPLPKKFKTVEVINAIDPRIDVDCLTDHNLGQLVSGQSKFIPPTPGAILEVFKYHRINLRGKHIVIVGPGTLIGRPLANLLMHQKVTLTVCSSGTKDLKSFTQQADIIICGVGKYKLLTGSMVKPGAVVIDAGICFAGAKMCGDIDFKSVIRIASLVTPTPGGIGPITVAKLLENTVLASKKFN